MATTDYNSLHAEAVCDGAEVYHADIPYTVQARITNAYFANKVVTVATDGSTTVDFRPIPITEPIILGKIVYLIVETEGMQGQNLQVAVQANNLLRERQPITARIVRREISSGSDTLRSAHNTLQQRQRERERERAENNIALNAERLLYFNGVRFAPANVFNATVGSFDALNSNSRTEPEPAHTNLEDEHADRAIIKLRLSPADRRSFNELASDINMMLPTRNNWQIRVQRQGAQPAFFNEDEEQSYTGTFNGVPVINRSFYEIYAQIGRDQDNPFNFLHEVQENERRRKIGLVRNNSNRQVLYFYYDQHGQEWQIWGEFTKETVMGRLPGNRTSRPTITTRPRESVPRGGVAEWHYFVRNAQNDEFEDIITTGGSSVPRRYNASGYLVDLIRMLNTPERINIRTGVTIQYHFASNGQRRYCSPGFFAAFIGVLGQYGRHSIGTTGVGFGNATGFPSRYHVDGVSIDISPYPSDRDNAIRLVGAFYDWGFTGITTGNNHPHLYGPRLAHDYDTQHNGHLHAGCFDADIAVHNIIT